MDTIYTHSLLANYEDTMAAIESKVNGMDVFDDFCVAGGLYAIFGRFPDGTWGLCEHGRGHSRVTWFDSKAEAQRHLMAVKAAHAIY